MTAQPSHVTAFQGRVGLLIHGRALLIAAGLVGLLGCVAVMSAVNGSYYLSLAELWATLTGNPPSTTADTVFWQFRLPRMIVAALSGALLGMSGATLQNVTRNPLADPSLVGVSQGAGLAVVALFVMFPDVSTAYRPAVALLGALLVAALIQWIAMSRTKGATMRFILTGIGVAAFISSLTSALLTYGQIDQATVALGWLAGSVHAAGWDEVRSLTLCLVALAPVLFWASRVMSALRMGPDLAIGFGVPVRPARIGLITLAVALAAFGVAAVGPLGFVGLVAPHLARRIAHCGVGQHLLLTGLIGAVMVGLADFAGRTAFAPIQIPAGIVTAIIGVPVFLFVILKSQTTRQL
jgi:iron complex transport system permease protein